MLVLMFGLDLRIENEHFVTVMPFFVTHWLAREGGQCVTKRFKIKVELEKYLFNTFFLSLFMIGLNYVGPTSYLV